MKRLCILCEDSKVAAARESAKEFSKSEVLTIPVSANGSLPATHWFCFLNATDEGFDQLISVREHCIMEELPPKEFLSKWKLKIIK